MNFQNISIHNIDDTVKYLLECDIKYFDVPMEKEILRMSRKYVILNIFSFIVLNKQNFPYRKEFFIMDKFIITSIFFKKFTNIYDYGISLNMDKKVLMKMKWDFWLEINWINNFVMTNCQEYHKSISINNLIHIRDIPEVKKVLKTPIDENRSIKHQEKQIDVIRTNLITAIKNDHSEENTLRHFLNLSLINKTQIAHILHLIGFRTDINESIVRYLIRGNYLDGLQNPFEYILEALSAKKALIYNKISLPDIQYFNRKQQLAIFGIKHVYTGDCGTNETIPIILNETNCERFLGKNIVEGGNLVTLNKNNIKRYIGKSVNMRSIVKCLYSNGMCEVCGGNLIKYFINPDYNIGHVGCVNFTSTTVQGVLSSKHYQTTNSLEYIIPDKLKPYFKLIKSSSSIFFRSVQKLDRLKIGFNMNDCGYLMNLKEIKLSDKSEINENSFGNFKYLSLMRGNEVLLDSASLKCNKQFPKLSKEFLLYIYNNFSKLEKFNRSFWIPLDNFDITEPIFNCTIINDSIVRYVKNISNFLEKDIKSAKSSTEALNTLSNILTKSNVNIAFIEILIKSFAVMNDVDYNYISPDTVSNYKLAGIMDINKFRSVGVSFAFERLSTSLNNPIYWLTPREINDFDYFLGINV